MDTKRGAARTAIERSRRAKWSRVRFRDNRDPETRGVYTAKGSMGHCWCGQRYGHTWPGQAEGKPHPR